MCERVIVPPSIFQPAPSRVRFKCWPDFNVLRLSFAAAAGKKDGLSVKHMLRTQRFIGGGLPDFTLIFPLKHPPPPPGEHRFVTFGATSHLDVSTAAPTCVWPQIMRSAACSGEVSHAVAEYPRRCYPIFGGLWRTRCHFLSFSLPVCAAPTWWDGRH